MKRWKGKCRSELKVSKWGKDRRGKEKLRHIYLVLDGWSWGYNIRKVDLSFGDSGWHSLPLASFKFEAPRGCPRYFASAYDTKILAVHPMGSKSSFMEGVLIYDVHMRRLVVCPRQKRDPIDPICITVGDNRLFALSSRLFQLLYPPPCHGSD
ncbi:hypothetical protein ACQ4PT_064893 [Festuca glaucescens]